MEPDALPRPSEATLVPGIAGLRPDGPGWFVLNLADASWAEATGHGVCTELEPAGEALGFEQLGFNLKVFGPGEPSTLNHREATEEDFLVLAGECVLIADGEELRLGPWDLFHCPAGVAHTLIGAGDGPCAVVMVGRRPEDATYVPDRVAARYGASPDRETKADGEAYADWPDHWDEVECGEGWLPAGRPEAFARARHREKRLDAGVPVDNSPTGIRPARRGAVVANLTQVPWRSFTEGGAHTLCGPADRAAESPDLGFNVHVLWPGQPSGMYHREAGEEGFLVVSGEALLLVEGQERRLGPWDFFHCPAGTDHIIVGAGDGPCAIIMVGARPDEPLVYPVEPVALRHGAGVAEETSDADEAYAGTDEGTEVAYPGCLPSLEYPC